MTPLLALIIGLLVAGAFFLFGLSRLRRRETDMRNRIAELSADAEKAFEMIASHPQGLLIRDMDSGLDIATPPFRRTFGLPENSDTAFDDLCKVLRIDDAERLRDHSQALIRYGKTFDMVLSRADTAEARLRVAGRLISSAGGTPMAQLLWASRAEDRASLPTGVSHLLKSKAFAMPQGDGRIAVETLLDLLPFPAWRRDQALDVVHVNEAGRSSEALKKTMALARTALEDGARTQARLETRAGDRRVTVTEAPLDGAFGTVGFVIDADGASNDDGFSRVPCSVLDGLANAVAVFGPDKRIVHGNRAYRDLWQLDKAWLRDGPGMRQILDRLRERRLLPEVPDYDRFRDEQSSMVGGLTETFEDRWHLPDGRTIHQVATPGPDGSLIVAFEDVSDRLRLERSYKSLDATQREILNALTEAVAVFDIGGRMTLCNDAFLALWDLPSRDRAMALSLKGFADHVAAIHAKSAQADQTAPLQKALLARARNRGRVARGDGQAIDYSVRPLAGESVMVACLRVEG